jgi:hypothetical protein
MTEDNIVQKIKIWKPMSKRWEDDVLGGIRSVNVNNWKNVAQNTDRWKKVVDRARTLHNVVALRNKCKDR